MCTDGLCHLCSCICAISNVWHVPVLPWCIWPVSKAICHCYVASRISSIQLRSCTVAVTQAASLQLRLLAFSCPQGTHIVLSTFLAFLYLWALALPSQKERKRTRRNITYWRNKWRGQNSRARTKRMKLENIPHKGDWGCSHGHNRPTGSPSNTWVRASSKRVKRDWGCWRSRVRELQEGYKRVCKHQWGRWRCRPRNQVCGHPEWVGCTRNHVDRVGGPG